MAQSSRPGFNGYPRHVRLRPTQTLHGTPTSTPLTPHEITQWNAERYMTGPVVATAQSAEWIEEQRNLRAIRAALQADGDDSDDDGHSSQAGDGIGREERAAMIQSALEELERLQRQNHRLRAESRRHGQRPFGGGDNTEGADVDGEAVQEHASGGGSTAEQRRQYMLEQLQRPATGSSVDWPHPRLIDDDVPAVPAVGTETDVIIRRETLDIPLEARIAIIRMRIHALVHGPDGRVAGARASRSLDGGRGRRADSEAGIDDAAPAYERDIRTGETLLARTSEVQAVEADGERAPPGYARLCDVV